MKITDFAKVFPVVAACLVVGSAVGAATYNCNVQGIEKTIWDMDRDKNQFLYENTAQHESRYGIACGHKAVDGCNNGVFALMPATHVWKSDSVNDIRLYRCNSVGGNAWEMLNLTGGGYIKDCTADQLKTYKHVGMSGIGQMHFYCKKVVGQKICVDETRTANGATSATICMASAEQYRCVNNGGKWNDSLRQCECVKSGQKWNGSKCEEDKEVARDKKEQECLNYGGVMIGGQCKCPDNEWLDTSATPPRCKSKNECPQGSQCNYGTVININDVGNVTDSGNSNVNTNQQNQQVNDNNQTTSNSSENNNSNENHNNSDNGNTTVIGDNNNVNNGGGQGGKTSLQKCLETRSTQNGKACCYLPKSGSNGATYNASTDTCTCNDGGKKFSIAANGRGQCIGNGGGNGGGGDSTPQCSDGMYYNATERRCMCSAENQTEINNNTACKCAIAGAKNDENGNCKCDDPKKVIVDGQCVYDANTQCPNGMKFDTVSGNCKCINPYQREINNYTACECTVPGAKNDANGICKCNEEGKTVQNGQCVYDENAIVNIRAKITASYGKLNSTMGGFEKSVWKDAEGNFNTARLASDSIAGVVLGTAGGIITSKLVKKNQLKQGFEDIKCSIGGQNVASYGDSFSVGM